MESIAQTCKSNSRTAHRPSTSGESGAEAPQDLELLQRAIKSVQRCTEEAGQGLRSTASKRLESAKRECRAACLKTISSSGTRPDAILDAAKVFVKKLSSAYTDEDVNQIKQFRDDAARLMKEHEDHRHRSDRRGRPTSGTSKGKGKVPNVEVVISTKEGLGLFTINATCEVGTEIQVLLRQVVLRAKGAQLRHAGKNPAASATAAPSLAGATTTNVGINNSTGSTCALGKRRSRECSSVGPDVKRLVSASGVADVGPDAGGGSATSDANIIDDFSKQKKSATPAVAITTTSVTAAAPTVPMKTEIEKGAHDGPDFSPTNETPEAYTEMTIPDFPEYEELRVAQEAQIRRNRLATKTEPPAPDATIGDKRRTWTAAPVATKADQPFVRGAQGKWRVLTPGYLSTDSEGGSGEDDEGGSGEEDGQG